MTSSKDGNKPAEFESAIRDFVRRDFSVRRERQPDGGVEAGLENVHSLIGRVTAASATEIERVIGELQTMRDKLREAGDRAQRELMSYADLSHTATASLKLVAESLARSRTVRPEAPDAHVADRAS
jgi:hypothetical protein